MIDYGIFDDQAADHTADEALEAQFYSRERAEARLAENREEFGEHAYVHAVEESEDEAA